MGFIPAPSPEMGDVSVETRRESFWLRGNFDSTEILYSDIPAVRAALDMVEALHTTGHYPPAVPQMSKRGAVGAA